MLFWYSKSYFDIRPESENRILTFLILFWQSNWVENAILIFKILFWHSNLVGKSYFVIQNRILTFELSRKILFWHSKSYFDIRPLSENRILTFKILFSHSKWVENNILTFKIQYWHLNWVGKCYFDFQNPNLTFELSRKTVFWHY